MLGLLIIILMIVAFEMKKNITESFEIILAPPTITQLPPETDEDINNHIQQNSLGIQYLRQCAIDSNDGNGFPQKSLKTDEQCGCIARLFTACPRYNKKVFRSEECQKSINSVISGNQCYDIGTFGHEFDNAVYPNF